MAELCQNKRKIFFDVSDHSNRYAKLLKWNECKVVPTCIKKKPCNTNLSYFKVPQRLRLWSFRYIQIFPFQDWHSFSYLACLVISLLECISFLLFYSLHKSSFFFQEKITQNASYRVQKLYQKKLNIQIFEQKIWQKPICKIYSLKRPKMLFLGCGRCKWFGGRNQGGIRLLFPGGGTKFPRFFVLF